MPPLKKILSFFALSIVSVLAGASVLGQGNGSVHLSHYIFGQFQPGKVKMKTGEVSEQQLNYNVMTNEMIFINAGKYLAIAKPEDVDTVFIADEERGGAQPHYREFVPQTTPGGSYPFYEVLTHNAAPLFLQYNATIIEPGNAIGYGMNSTTTASPALQSIISNGSAYELKLPDGFKVTPVYIFWIRKGGKFEKANSEQQLRRIFKDNEQLIKDLVKKRHPNFSDRKEMIGLVEELEGSTMAKATGAVFPRNPVLDRNFPDPTLIRAEGKYYVYATQGRVEGKMWNIQVASSTDLRHWTMETDALPRKPFWASTTQAFWAPHVLFDPALQKYVLFFSSDSDDKKGKCIGVAFADRPTGPFTDKGSPLVCGEGFVNIDPMALIDPKTGRKLLYWGSGFQPLKVREMTGDWKDFVAGSYAIPIVWPNKEKNYTQLIEGAWVDYDQGKYYCYYSGDNCCGEKANYAVMVARSENATGPFQRLGEINGTGSSVILEKDGEWIAPGHNSVLHDEKGGIWIAYHAIRKGAGDAMVSGAGKEQERVLCLDALVYENGWPKVIKN